jgi:hypothetical protein
MYKLILTLAGLSLMISCTSSNEKKTSEHSQMQKQVQETMEYTTIYEDSLLQIQDAWTRVAPEGGMSAGFMRLSWKTESSDSLINFYTEACERHEIHETYEKGEGMMGMRQIKGLKLSSEEIAELKPSGKHLMLMQLTQDFVAGDSIAVRLDFKQRESVELYLPIRSLTD